MELTDFSFFTDENIHPSLVDLLRTKGFDVFDTKENNLFGATDAHLLKLATDTNRVIITLDSDFGTMVYKGKAKFIGIIFLKQGHFDSSHHIQTIQALLDVKPNLEKPFMVIAEWANTGIKIRIKNAIF